MDGQFEVVVGRKHGHEWRRTSPRVPPEKTPEDAGGSAWVLFGALGITAGVILALVGKYLLEMF